MSAYPGMVALVLAGAGVAAGFRNRRVIALAVVAAVTFAIALSSSTLLAELIYALPLYGRFKSWTRYLLGVDFAIAMLAGYGVAALRSDATVRRTCALRGALGTGTIVLVLALVVSRLGPVKPFLTTGHTRLYALIVPVAAAAAGMVLCLSLWRGARRTASALVVVAVFADSVLGFGLWLEWRTRSPSPGELRAAVSRRHPPRFGSVTSPDGGIVRTIYLGRRHEGKVAVVGGVLKEIRSANGNDPLAPKRYVESLSMRALGVVKDPKQIASSQSHVLDLLRVAVVLDDAGRPLAGLPGGRVVAGGRLLRHERRPRLPDAFLVGQAKRVTGAEAVRAIRGTTPFEPSATALFEGACRSCERARRPGRAGRVTATVWGRQSVSIDVAAARAGMLVVSQAWFPGWSATVDGRAEPALRADGLLIGVPVAAGTHHVVLRYHAPGLRAGALLTIATCVALLVWAVGARVVRRRGAVNS
jgi:hypothetical protein